jgi:hypothetical protein
MNRSPALLSALALSTLALGVTHARVASACGGCFHEPPPPNQQVSDITDERMLLSVSGQQSTLYDQIRYSGNPGSFAWVLPIQGTVDVGLSADVLFGAIDSLTQTVINAPPYPCAPAPFCGYGAFGATAAGSGSASSGTSAYYAPPPVQVLKADNVGPYATVQLKSTNATALETWLSQNGYMIPADVQPVIAAYLAEGFDFLAMKLLPNQGVQAMRPVRVTTSGSVLGLPMRMASVGTGAVTGITIWVVADGRYEPQNYPFFHIDDSDLVWDWGLSASNYTTLRKQHETALMGAGWEIESSLDLNQQTITNLILSGGASASFGLAPADASQDYLAVGSPDAGVGAAVAYQSAEDVRRADIAALFMGLSAPTVRVTRIRSDIAHAAMTKDFILRASSDQSEMSNVRSVTRSTNYTCPTYQPCGGLNPPGGSSGSVPGSSGSFGSSGSAAGASGDGSVTVKSFPDNHACAAAPSPARNLAAGLGAALAAIVLGVGRIVRRRRTR